MINAREARIAAEASNGYNDKRTYTEKLAANKYQMWLASCKKEIDKLMRPIWDKIADAAGYGCTHCYVAIGDTHYRNTEIDIRKYYQDASPIGQTGIGSYLSLVDLRHHIAAIIAKELRESGYEATISRGADYATYEDIVSIDW